MTPDRTLVDREVARVSFHGIDGSYGILPHHAPLMTAISSVGKAKITELDGRTLELFVSDGFAQVQHNVLTLVCEAGEFAHEIDMERVKAAEAKAREKLSGLVFAAGEQITSVDLPDPVRAAVPRDPEYQVNLREATAEFERAHILRIIEQCGGNKRKAAKLLGLGVNVAVP